MRVLLTEGLTRHMRSMTALEARSLADELTTVASSYVRRMSKDDAGTRSPLESLPSFPKESWNELTIGVPWEAYSHAHGACEGELIACAAQALCSAPAQLDRVLSEQAMSSGLWGGSLMVALGKILEGVKRDLIVFSPYWRVSAVQSLLASAGRQSYADVSVTIFSQPKIYMRTDDKEGLCLFINLLRSMGALVRVLAPRSHDGFIPILHAKLIIADSESAYVGSANFTKSGLDHGIEAGVLVQGETAKAFAEWSRAIVNTCDPW